jgi:hypothetical protein
MYQGKIIDSLFRKTLVKAVQGMVIRRIVFLDIGHTRSKVKQIEADREYIKEGSHSNQYQDFVNLSVLYRRSRPERDFFFVSIIDRKHPRVHSKYSLLDNYTIGSSLVRKKIIRWYWLHSSVGS